jgi:hypothetical protein
MTARYPESDPLLDAVALVEAQVRHDSAAFAVVVEHCCPADTIRELSKLAESALEDEIPCSHKFRFWAVLASSRKSAPDWTEE